MYTANPAHPMMASPTPAASNSRDKVRGLLLACGPLAALIYIDWHVPGMSRCLQRLKSGVRL